MMRRMTSASASTSCCFRNGLITGIALAAALFQQHQHHVCDAFSFPRFPLLPPTCNINGRGFNGGGGSGGNTPRRNARNFYDGDGNESDADGIMAFDLASLFGISFIYDEPNDNDVSIDINGEGASADEETREESLASILVNYRGGGTATTCESPGNKNNIKKSFWISVDDKLDSIQTMMFQPFRTAGSALTNKLPANPFQKSKGDQSEQSEESKLKKQEELLSSTKVQSVAAPGSTLLPPDVVTQCAKESNLIGGTLTPETLDLTAKMINRQYLEHGYVMNSVTGATLVPAPDGKEDDDDGDVGHVELKVREVRLARPKQGKSSPVYIRFVEKNDDKDTGDNESVISLPSQSSSDQSQPDHQTYKTVSGRTRPSKIAKMVKLIPGSHFCILPDRWSQLAAFPGGAFGGGQRDGGKSAIFSTIHAIRPVPSSKGDDTVELEIIATENKPYISLEYGVTKSLYSDKWEGELDLKHASAFGGGEVATLNVRKGKSSGNKKEDPTMKNWSDGVTGGPLNWRISLKDDYLGGSDAGYDLEVFRDHVGVSGNGGSISQDVSDESKEEEAPDLKDHANQVVGSPLRTGASMRLRLPRTSQSFFMPKALSARFERVDPSANDDRAQCMTSMSADIGPYRQGWNVLFRPLQSTISATAMAGGRWSTSSNTGESDDDDDDTNVLPYATGTISSHQILALDTGDIAMRNVVSASSKHLPRHEAILLGLSSRVRGYKYNFQRSPMSQQANKIEKEQQQSVLQSLKQLLKGGDGQQIRPPIALSKSISGKLEFRLPFESLARRGSLVSLQPILGSGNFVLFGDWCFAQAQSTSPSLLSEEETSSFAKPFRHSSVGIGVRKVVQGLPIKVDACITEHGTKGVFFGMGHDFGL